MINFLVGPFKYLATGAVVALTALLGIIGWGRAKKKEGASTVILEALQEDKKKVEKAREVAQEEKRNVNGISDSDLVDRLRRRSDDWGRL